jgi:hypothetical protein
MIPQITHNLHAPRATRLHIQHPFVFHIRELRSAFPTRKRILAITKSSENQKSKIHNQHSSIGNQTAAMEAAQKAGLMNDDW